MESHSHHPNTIVRNGVITLEHYLALTDSHKTEDLTVNHLNQIVAMHGFTKLKASKKVIIDAVNTLELMSVTRSTLKENIHSSVNIKPEEVITDLNILNWQECTVTSIQLINSLDDENSNHSQSCLQIPDQPKSIKSKTKPKQQVKSDSSDVNEASIKAKAKPMKKLKSDGSDVPSSSINEAPSKEKPEPKRKLKSVSDIPSSGINESPIKAKPEPKKKLKSVSDAPSSLTEVSKSDSVGRLGSGSDVPSSSINEAPIKEKSKPKKKLKSVSGINEAPIKAKPEPKKKLKSVSDAPSSSLTEVSKSDSVGTLGSGESVENRPKGEESVEKPKIESVAEKPKSKKRKSLHMKSIIG